MTAIDFLDGGSPKVTDTTNSKGEFEVDMKAPDNPGNYDIKAKFDGDSQYTSSDSSVKITVEETIVSNQKTTVMTTQQTGEQQTGEQQTGEQQTGEQQTNQQEPEDGPEEEPEE